MRLDRLCADSFFNAEINVFPSCPLSQAHLSAECSFLRDMYCPKIESTICTGVYKNEKNISEYVGTLNGSGLAVGRTLIGIMENYQNIKV